MADRMNIKFTIQAVDRFTTTMKRLERQLDSLQRKADRFDLNMKADVDLDTNEAFERLAALERRSEALSRQINRKRKIDVDTNSARRDINVLERSLMVIDDNTRFEVDMDVDRAMGGMRRLTNNVRRQALEMGDSLERALVPRDPYEVDMNFSPALREAARTRRYMGEIFESRPLLIEADVDLDTAGASAQASIWRRAMDAMLRIEARLRIDRGSMARATATVLGWEASMRGARVLVDIAFNNYNTFRRRAASLATNLRNMGEIFQGMGTGIIITFASTLSPLIASTTGMIASLGNMIGVTAGATMGLLSSFVGAGIAAGGFAAIAIPSLVKLHETVNDIGSLEEKIEMAEFHGNAKQAAKYTAELNKMLEEMSPAQRQAAEAVSAFKQQFEGLRSAMEPGVLTAYAGVLTWVTTLFEKAEPMIERTVAVVGRLADSLNANIEATDMKAFFEFLNTRAPQSLETIAKALGNFLMGFFNLMVAFSPLALDMENGFLSMSEGFRKWTSALGENKKFQAFVDYTRENWPKVKEIIGDAIAGIIELFAGFAPYASEWMDTTRDMLNGFRDFAQGLGENQQFQDFLNFIKTNAPAVTAFIGNIVKTLVELGIAMAPVGVAMLDVANNILEWIQNFRQANPVLSNVIIWITMLIGAFILLMAPVLLAVSVFTSLWQSFVFILGPIGKVLLWVNKLLWGITNLGGVVMRFLPWIGQLIARFIAFLGPVGLVISIVIALAAAIYANWGTIGPWIANLWDKVKAYFQAVWAAIPPLVSAGLRLVVSFIQTMLARGRELFSSILSAIATIVKSRINAVQTVFRVGMNAARAIVNIALNTIRTIFSNVMNAVRTVVSNVLNAIRNLYNSVLNAIRSRVMSALQSIRNAFSTGMAAARSVVTIALNAIRNFFQSAMSSIITRVTTAISRVRTAFSSGMNRVKTIVSNAVDRVKALFDIDLAAQGRKIVESVAAGISGAIGTVTKAIGKVTDKIRDFLPFSPAKEGALRDLDKLNFGGTMAKSITRQTGTVRRAMASVMEAARPDVNYAVDNAYSSAGREFTTMRADRDKKSHTVVEVPVYLHGKEIARASNAEQNKMNEREAARVAAFRRTGGA